MISVRMAFVTVALCVATAGCATLAQAPAPTLTTTDAQRRECERNAGSWSSVAGFCRIGQ